MIRKIVFAAFALATFLLATDNAFTSSDSRVYSLQLDDTTINPITAQYISRSIDKATEEGAEAVIIRLDTPGGFLSSTRTIVKKILSANIPIVVYIYPSGSRAGSAGVFITYASHVAAMAPSTNIGAAHPVEIGGGERKEKDQNKGMDDLAESLREILSERRKNTEKSRDESSRTDRRRSKKEDEEKPAEEAGDEDSAPSEDPMSDKILNDTLAWIRAIAKQRGRNIEWAVKSVSESDSITETEALEKGVIEIIAKDEKELLEKLDGRTVKLGQKEIQLATKDAQIIQVLMDPRQEFFNVLANPNIAYILLILGFYGLLYEITHPGFGLPGILGAIFLILAFYSLQTLPTNYAALALILLGIVLFIGEATTPGFGVLAITGFVCMVLGSLLLFDTSLPMFQVSLSVILSFTLTTAAITIFLVRAVLTVHRRKKMGGQEGMVGEKGYAYTNLSLGKEGKVFVHGEIWNAITEDAVRKNEKIEVVKVDGMRLTVKPEKS